LAEGRHGGTCEQAPRELSTASSTGPSSHLEVPVTARARTSQLWRDTSPMISPTVVTRLCPQAGLGRWGQRPRAALRSVSGFHLVRALLLLSLPGRPGSIKIVSERNQVEGRDWVGTPDRVRGDGRGGGVELLGPRIESGVTGEEVVSSYWDPGSSPG